MLVSLNWIKKYVKFPEGLFSKELAEKLTFSGLEVEAIHSQSKGLEKVYVGEIVEKKAHPTADHLSLTKLALSSDKRKNKILSIVCGADNIALGDKVPVALIGAQLPNGMKIKAAKIRGEESCGMLCSPEELGLFTAMEKKGIYILPKDSPVGEPFARCINRNDEILDISLTPNRGDLLSHIGIAREIAAIWNLSLKLPSIQLKEEVLTSSLEIQNEYELGTKAYLARLVESVQPGPSPDWLRNSLESVGIRSVNNLVDISNYIMMETGQPVHIFDADTLVEKSLKEGVKIVLRRARPKESLLSISEKEIQLKEEDILVTAEGAKTILAALAGVMGSKSTELSDSTRNILIETAHFSPTCVRKTSQNHSLHTEASYRFSRGIDLRNLPWVLDRTAQLVQELAGGRVGKRQESLSSIKNIDSSLKEIALEEKDIVRCLGKSPPLIEVKDILTRLGFAIKEEKNHILLCSVPSWRTDVEIVEDLVEELGRVWGYEHLSSKLPIDFIDFSKNMNAYQDNTWHLKEHLASLGFSEAINYAFSSKSQEAILGEEKDSTTVELMSPLGQDYTILKTSLVPGLLRNLLHNISHRKTKVRLYELRTCFYKDKEKRQNSSFKKIEKLLDTKTKEKTILGIIFSGTELDEDWSRNEQASTFYDLKGIVESVLERMGKNGVIYKKESIPKYLHPGKAATLFLGPRTLGSLGRLHPKIEKELSIAQATYLAEIDAEFLCAKVKKRYKYKSYSNFPSVDRDFSILVHEKVTAQVIRDLVQRKLKSLLKKIEFFDVYKGDRVPLSHTSYAFRIVLQSDTHTLTEEEISQAQNTLMTSMRNDLGAKFAGEV